MESLPPSEPEISSSTDAPSLPTAEEGGFSATDVESPFSTGVESPSFIGLEYSFFTNLEQSFPIESDYSPSIEAMMALAVKTKASPSTGIDDQGSTGPETSLLTDVEASSSIVLPDPSIDLDTCLLISQAYSLVEKLRARIVDEPESSLNGLTCLEDVLSDTTNDSPQSTSKCSLSRELETLIWATKAVLAAKSIPSPWNTTEISSLNELLPYEPNVSPYGIVRFKESGLPAVSDGAMSAGGLAFGGYREFYTQPYFSLLESVALELKNGFVQDTWPRILHAKEWKEKRSKLWNIQKRIDSVMTEIQKAKKHTKQAVRAWKGKITEIVQDVEDVKRIGREFPPNNYQRMLMPWRISIRKDMNKMIKKEQIFPCIGWTCDHRCTRLPKSESITHPLNTYDYFELRNVGRAFGQGVHFGDLSNEIHPLFRDIAQTPGTQPFLREASRALTEEVFMPFWHALLAMRLRRCPKDCEDLGGQIWEISLKKTPLTPAEIEWTRNGLLQVAAHLKKMEWATDEEGYWARTTFSKERVGYSTPRRLPDGSRPVKEAGSIITVSEAWRTVLHPLSHYGDEDRLRAGFLLSRTLTHEVAHAVWVYASALFSQNARPTKEDCQDRDDDGSSQSSDSYHSSETSWYGWKESFLEGQRECEIGAAWDEFSWGGQFGCHGSADNDHDPFQYLHFGLLLRPINPDYGSDAEDMVRGKPRKFCSRYVVPMEFIQKHYTEQFWSVEVKKVGLRAFGFPKIFGLRDLNEHWKDGMSDGTPSRDSSRERYPDEEGIIRSGNPDLGNWDKWKHASDASDSVVDSSDKDARDNYKDKSDDDEDIFGDGENKLDDDRDKSDDDRDKSNSDRDKSDNNEDKPDNDDDKFDDDDDKSDEDKKTYKDDGDNSDDHGNSSDDNGNISDIDIGERVHSVLGFTKESRRYLKLRERKKRPVKNVASSVLAYLKALPPLEERDAVGESSLTQFGPLASTRNGLQRGCTCARRHSWPNECAVSERVVPIDVVEVMVDSSKSKESRTGEEKSQIESINVKADEEFLGTEQGIIKASDDRSLKYDGSEEDDKSEDDDYTSGPNDDDDESEDDGDESGEDDDESGEDADKFGRDDEEESD